MFAMSTLSAPIRWISSPFVQSKFDALTMHSRCSMTHGDFSFSPPTRDPRQFRQPTVPTVARILKSSVSPTTHPGLPPICSKHASIVFSSPPAQSRPPPPPSLAVTSEGAAGKSDPSTPPTKPPLRVIPLIARDISADSFAPYGTLVGPTEDGTPYGPQDADLDLTQGNPRVYVMRLRNKPLSFDRITFHACVTQCLAACGPPHEPWYLAVAKPSVDLSGPEVRYRAPQEGDIEVFRILPPQLVQLNASTWHAGPFFRPEVMDFFNLELRDTNKVDHATHSFKKMGVEFEIQD